MARKFARKRWRRPERMTLEGPPVVRRKDVVVPSVLVLEPHGAHRDNGKRMARLLAVFFALAAAEGVVVWLAAGFWLAVPVALGLAFAYVLAGSRFGDRWMHTVLGAEPSADPVHRNLLAGVAGVAGVSCPELVVGPGDAVNAIALGLRRRWVLLTKGSLELEGLQLEAMMAHEVCHLRDADGALASVYVLLGGAVELATKALHAPAGVFLLLAIPLWPVCLIVQALRPVWFPRQREHRADVAGAMVVRYPPGMHRALGSAGAEQGPARLRATDPFWFAPRGGASGPDVAERGRLVSEM